MTTNLFIEFRSVPVETRALTLPGAAVLPPITSQLAQMYDLSGILMKSYGSLSNLLLYQCYNELIVNKFR